MLRWVSNIVEKMTNLEKVIYFSGCQAKENKKLKPPAASKGLIARIMLRIHVP